MVRKVDEMKHALFISYDGMTDSLGQSQVIPYLKGLRKVGYKISLISCEKKERFKQHKEVIKKILHDADIDWYPLNYLDKLPILSAFLNAQAIRKQTKKIHQQNPIHLLHCRSYLPAITGLYFKKKYGTKLLFDMRGFWADERVDGNVWKLNNPIYKLVYNYFKRYETEFLVHSDHIVSLTHNGKNEMLTWSISNLSEEKITVIPCCVDLNLFDPNRIDTNQLTERKRQLNIDLDDYVLGYVGSIGTWYMLDEMLDYFVVLKQTNPKAKFLFVTGENPDNIIQKGVQKGISRTDLIITSVLHNEVALHIGLFDKSIFFILPSYSKKASSPTKQGEIMAMGIPLVCNAGVGDTDHIVNQFHSGSIIHNFTNEDYLKEIENSAEFNKNACIEGAKTYFSLEEGVRRYTSIYRKLIG